MTITAEIKESLEREFNICSTTINFYKRQIKVLEKKYRMTTASFLMKFERAISVTKKIFLTGMPFKSSLQAGPALNTPSSRLLND